jgi:hypothetical protein
MRSLRRLEDPDRRICVAVAPCPRRSGRSYPCPPTRLQVATGIADRESVVFRDRRVARQDRPHHAGQGVDPLAAVHRLDCHEHAAAGQQGQRDAAPTAATSRVTASGGAVSGRRTTTPEGRTTSAIGSATTRTGTNGDGFDLAGSAARMRRRRSKLDRVTLRSRQKALTVWPDRCQASNKSRQTRTRSGLRHRMAEFSPPRKTQNLPDGARRTMIGQLRRTGSISSRASFAPALRP